MTAEVQRYYERTLSRRQDYFQYRNYINLNYSENQTADSEDSCQCDYLTDQLIIANSKITKSLAEAISQYEHIHINMQKYYEMDDKDLQQLAYTSQRQSYIQACIKTSFFQKRSKKIIYDKPIKAHCCFKLASLCCKTNQSMHILRDKILKLGIQCSVKLENIIKMRAWKIQIGRITTKIK